MLDIFLKKMNRRFFSNGLNGSDLDSYMQTRYGLFIIVIKQSINPSRWILVVWKYLQPSLRICYTWSSKYSNLSRFMQYFNKVNTPYLKNLRVNILTEGPYRRKVTLDLKKNLWWQSWNWNCKLGIRLHFQFHLYHQGVLSKSIFSFPIYG